MEKACSTRSLAPHPKRGAEAIVIRSVGIDNNRNGHTGSGYGYEEGVRKIPAAAVSALDQMPDGDYKNQAAQRLLTQRLSRSLLATDVGNWVGDAGDK